MKSLFLRLFLNFGPLLFITALGWGEIDSVVILHTNDIHDHIRPGYNGLGGMPYVSGYIKSVKAQRNDVLVLDAGDVTEKGDLVAFIDKSRTIYRAMAMIGYDAGTPGNHEYDEFGRWGINEFKNLAGGMDILCLNLLTNNGKPELPTSKIYDVDGVKVAVIGLIVPRKYNCLNAEESAIALAREAERLDKEADLIVALCHLGTKSCRELAQVARSVDVFVGGHSHEELNEPVRVKETGAIIVQAGSYARNVGRLELEIDLDTEEILKIDGKLIAMRHDTIPVDEEMLAWAQAEEKRLCPEASEVLGYTSTPIMHLDVGWLAAAAMREFGNVDVSFCKTEKIIRGFIPHGEFDYNAVFLTGGQRGYDLVKVELTGAEIEAYLNALSKGERGLTQWAGFIAEVKGKIDEDYQLKSNLKPYQFYTVIMPALEWAERFLTTFQKVRDENDSITLPPERDIAAEPLSFHFTDAVAYYIRERNFDKSNSLLKHIHSIVAAQTTGDWDDRMAVPKEYRYLLPPKAKKYKPN